MSRITIEAIGEDGAMRRWLAALPRDFDRIGTTIFRGRNTLKECEADGRRLVVKRFKPDGLIKRTVNRFRAGKARKSYRNALRLGELGIATPAPVGCVEVRNAAGFVTDQYYVCLHSPAQAIEPLVLDPTDYDPAFMTALATYFVELHSRGVLHRDSNNTNIRYMTGPDGRPEFSLIDINRMEFRELTPADCLRNITHFSALTEGFRFMAAEYLRLRGWAPSMLAEAVRVKRGVDEAYARLRRRKARLRCFLGRSGS